MIDTQQILQTIHRNQQQIDLLTTNNTQLIEYLLHAGALEAVRSLHEPPPTNGRSAIIAEMPQLPAPAKRGRPPLQRYDSLGRRIPTNKKPSPGRPKIGTRTGSTWSPEQRANHAATIAKKKHTWTVAQRRKLSQAMKEADRRKKELGENFKTKRELAAEARAEARA